jgi:hypothetical protein
MGVVKLSTAGIVNYEKYSNLRAGIPLPPTGDYDLLATEILTSSTSSVTFSSLGDYATDYQHLQIRFVARSTRSGNTDDPMNLQFNTITSGYFNHQLSGDGSSVTSGGATSESAIRVGRLTAASSSANAFGAGVIDILDPFETTKNTTFRSLSGSTNSNLISVFSGSHATTSALTEIKLLPLIASFASGSRFSLYGLKGSA